MDYINEADNADRFCKLHEHNKNFDWSIPSGPYEFLSHEQVKSFDEDGYTVIEDAFTSDELEKVLEMLSLSF